jgi:transcriptional regulator with XRE-family HTH domain
MPDEQETLELGRALQVRRAELGLKRRELADRALLSYPYVSEIENGAKTPSAKALRQLADALRLTPAELMARADRPSAVDEVPPEDSRSARLAPHAQLGYAPSSIGWSRLLADAMPDMAMARILASDSLPDQPSDGRASGVWMPDGILERWIGDLVARVVQAELAAWRVEELPGLVAQECRRIHDDGDGSGDDDRDPGVRTH